MDRLNFTTSFDHGKEVSLISQNKYNLYVFALTKERV